MRNVLQETMRYGISVMYRLPYYSYNDFGYMIISCSPLDTLNFQILGTGYLCLLRSLFLSFVFLFL